MVTQFLEVLARAVVRHRGRWTIGMLMLTCGFGWLATGLATRFDRTDFLPDSIPKPDSVESEILKRIGGSSRVVVYLKSADSIAVDDVSPLLNRLADRLRVLPGVEAVAARIPDATMDFVESELPARFPLYLSPNALRLIGQRLSYGGMKEALLSGNDSSQTFRLPEDPLGVTGIVATTLGQIAGASPIQIDNGYVTVRDRSHFFVVVDLFAGSADVNQTTTIVSTIQSTVSDVYNEMDWEVLRSTVAVSVIGRPVSYVSATETLRADIRRTGLAALSVVFVLLALYFRSVRLSLLVLLPIVFGLLVAAAVGAVLWESVSVMALIFVGVLFGLGVDYGVHIVTHHRMHGRERRGEALVAFALARPGRGVLFAGLTSVAAFASLGAISYPITRQVAVLSSVGIFATLIGAFLILPIGLSFIRPVSQKKTSDLSRDAERQKEKQTMELKQARTESRTGDRRIWKLDEHLLRGLRKRSLAPWLLLVIATIPAMFFINFEPHPWSLAVRGNPKSAELDRLSREIGTSFSPLLLVSRGSTREQAIDRDRRAVNLLRPGAMRSEIVTIESISSWLPSKEQQQTNIDYLRGSADLFSSRRFVRDYDALVLEYPDRAGRLTPEYRDLIATYLDPVVSPLEVDDLPPQLDRHVLELNDEYVAVSYLYLKRFPWATGALDRLRDTLRLLRFDELQGTRLEGEALNSGAHSEALTVDLARAMAVVSVLVILILWLQFGSLAPVGLCLLPSICGACAALVAMSLFRIELNMLTLSIAPLLIGIGIDDGIHIVERLRMRQERSQIFREAGTCMAITTVTTAAAFMCMLLGQFAGVRESGLLGATGLVVSFLAAVHAVPLLAERWKIFS